MKNIIIITEDGEQLISSTDDGTNQLIINDTVIPSADWVGTGTYTDTIHGHNISIDKAPASTGNIQLIKLADYSYSLKIIKDISSLIIDTIYPVGSYYETSDNTFDPNVVWGGSWILETEGQVHVSAGNNYTVSGALSNTSDGGSKDAIVVEHHHNIAAKATGGMSANENHAHGINNTEVNAAFMGMAGSGSDSGLGEIRVTAVSTGSNYVPRSSASGINFIRVSNTKSNSLAHTHTLGAHDTNDTGSDGTDANMQPYIVVYRWHRTA